MRGWAWGGGGEKEREREGRGERERDRGQVQVVGTGVSDPAPTEEKGLVTPVRWYLTIRLSANRQRRHPVME